MGQKSRLAEHVRREFGIDQRHAPQSRQVHVAGAHLVLGHVGQVLHQVRVARSREDHVREGRLALAHGAQVFAHFQQRITGR